MASTTYSDGSPSDPVRAVWPDEPAQIGADPATGEAQEPLAQFAAALREIEGLRTALTSHRIIGQAAGILMERFDLTADAAFDVLRRLSSNRNVRLRRIAHGIVETRTTPTGSALYPSSNGPDEHNPRCPCLAVRRSELSIAVKGTSHVG